MRFARLLAVAMVALGLLAGCKSSCRQLSEKLCECAINSFDRNACLQKVSTAESSVVLTQADNARCAPLVGVCDCRLTDTPQGKINCGLAWPPDSGVAY